MRSFRFAIAALAAACPAGGFAAAADANTLATRALASRGDRFIELALPVGARSYANIAADRTITYGDGAIEMRTRGAAAATLRYEFTGANATSPQGLNDSGTTYNYLVGDRKDWATGLKSYSQVAYRGLWKGIDATYSGDRSGIKYHFDVAPGAKAASIAFVVRGARDARIASDGAIEWTVGGAVLRDEAPVAYQSGANGERIVPAAFTLAKLDGDAWRLGFDVTAYDATLPLTVDPAWTAFAGLVGGNAADQVFAVARDASGNTFACGVTASTDIPGAGIAKGDNDAFIVKFNAAGAAQFVTYFGGNGFDACTGIALDGADGTLFITGGTTSTNFPFAGGADANFRKAKSTTDRDAFVSHLGANGSTVLYSGVIGGSGEDQANAIALDSSSRAYVTGYTSSSSFPFVNGPSAVRQGAMDAFVARVSQSGSVLEYAGTIGGNGDIESGHGIAVAADSTAYVVGETNSTTSLPSMAGSFRSTVGVGDSDGFVARVTFLGSVDRFAILTGIVTGAQTGIDRARGVAINADGSIVVVGETDSGTFPAVGAAFACTAPSCTAKAVQTAPSGNMDGFVVRLAGDLSSVTAYSYLGGSRFDTAESVAADALGNIFVTGTSANANSAGVGANGFPAVATRGLSASNLGLQDGFLARILGAAANYLGFVGNATNDAMHAIAVDGSGVLTLGGATGAITGAGSGALSAGASSSNGAVLRINPYGPPNTVNIASGSPQSASVNAAFANPLRARVVDIDALGVPGITVTFTPPASGASATLSATSAVTDAGGFAQVTATANLIGGAYNVVASASGAGSGNFALTNDKVASTTTLASSLNPSTAGQSVTFTATVSGALGAATGTIDFRDGATSIAACGAIAVTAGSAVCTTSTLTTADHSLTAVYSGNNTYNTSASATVTQTVKAVPAVALASSANPSTSGQAVVFTASVSGTSGTPTGTVAFHDAGTPIAGCAAVAIAASTASCSSSALSQGTHSITAAYSGDATYAPATSAALSQAVAAAPLPTHFLTDLNGNGKSDLLWRNSSTGEVYRHLMNGLGFTDGATAYIEPDLAWKVVGDADFNADGTSDLLWRNSASGQLFQQPFNASGLPAGGTIFYNEPNAAWKVVHTPDLDGDGKADLLWWNQSTGQVYAMLMNGASIAAQGTVAIEPDTNWKIAAVGDFAGSGKSNQLLWRNAATGQLYLMTVAFSGGVFTQSGVTIYSEPNLAWKVIAAADFNGDGKSDILYRNDTTGQVFMMLMNGSAIASSGMVYAEPNLAWKIVSVGDYNGDGKSDLLWRNDSGGGVHMMLMNGLAIAAQGAIYTEPNLAWRLLGPWEYAQ